MRAKFGFKENDVVILNAGKLNSGKKSFELLQTFQKVQQKYSKSFLVFVGGGETSYLQKIGIIRGHRWFGFKRWAVMC